MKVHAPPPGRPTKHRPPSEGDPKKGVVDESSTSLELLATADLIFICTPIHLIVPTLENLTPYLKTQAVVTDVGSVKGAIVANCSRLWSNFVGSHPMAGKTEQGINAAQLCLSKIRRSISLKFSALLFNTSTNSLLL